VASNNVQEDKTRQEGKPAWGPVQTNDVHPSHDMGWMCA
jgi:hypothetical protein